MPVLVNDARLPAAGELPDELKPLLRRHAIELRDTHWDADVDQLLATIARAIAPGTIGNDQRADAQRAWRRRAAAVRIRSPSLYAHPSPRRASLRL